METPARWRRRLDGDVAYIRSGLYGVEFHQLSRDNLGTGSFDDISYIDVEKSQFFKSLQNSMVCRTENWTWLHG